MALPAGGTPYFQRGSDSLRAQSLMLNGGFAMTKSACSSGCRSRANVSPQREPRLPDRPWIARFIFAMRHVRSLSSWPYTEMSRALAVVRLEELLGLHEHAARPAARVVDAAVRRLQQLDEHPHHAGGRVELAAPLALGGGELLEEVLVHLAEQVARAASRCPDWPCPANRAELSRSSSSPRRRWSTLSRLKMRGRVPVSCGFVCMTASIASSISRPIDFSGASSDGPRPFAFSARNDHRAFGRHPEDAAAGVLVGVVDELGDLVLVVAVGGELGADLLAALVERVGDVLEEDEPEDDVLVLRGVHRAAQLVGGLPERVLQLLHRRRRLRGGFRCAGHGVLQCESDAASAALSVSVTAPETTPAASSLA